MTKIGFATQSRRRESSITRLGPPPSREQRLDSRLRGNDLEKGNAKLAVSAGWLLLIVLLALSGCAKRAVYLYDIPPERALERVDAAQIDLSDDLDAASLLLAIDRSLAYYDGAGRNQVFNMAGRRVDAGLMKQTLAALRKIIQSNESPDQKKKRIAHEFIVLRAAGQTGVGDVLFTGYYVPQLSGSRTRTDLYRYPLYKTPPDLIVEKTSANSTKVSRKKNGGTVPYYTRREIDGEGALAGRGLELLWVSDAADLFSLHIQGSGKIRLEDGTFLTVSAAQHNGWPYRSMPPELLDEIRRDQGNTSYASVKAWLKSRTDEERNRALSYYDRYIFYRFVDKDPIGGLGQPVTPDRTIATDPDYFPPGAPAFIRLRKPVLDANYNVISRAEFSRFVLNQDKGSAIKGPGRVDLFCGFGPRAQAAAGSLKEKGELYFLLLK